MRKLINQIKSRARRRGAAMVEMAIVLPVLMILTMGLIEYGWVFLRVSQINMAARHGVRVAVRPGSTEDNVKNSVKNMMKEYGFKESDYTLTYTDINVGVSEPITVHINVPYTNKSLTGMGFLPLPDKIQGHGTMVKEGAPTGS